ncbi:hypothetical protein T01_14906 [Trichinella spiralis]|uniref:Uncharacterized protein n=1 Tax=Trichinella spiralis TaxID=6334 RepID=A0A0V1B4J6_TRISP|nr:hypothetical protein T01_14906 [Trichinella spiralis]
MVISVVIVPEHIYRLKYASGEFTIEFSTINPPHSNTAARRIPRENNAQGSKPPRKIITPSSIGKKFLTFITYSNKLPVYDVLNWTKICKIGPNHK